MKKVDGIDILLVSVVLVVIFASAMCMVLLPANEFSKKENRPLAPSPFSDGMLLESLSAKSFLKNAAAYFCDRFPLRDSLTALCSLCELAFGKREINNTLVCDENTLVSHRPRSRQQTLRLYDNIARINESNFKLFIPPSPAEVFFDRLPYSPDRSLVFDTPNAQNELLAIFAESPNLYYRTDHHWSTHGSFAAYQYICRSLELEPFPLERFSQSIVFDDFYGSAMWSSALPRSLVSPDSICLYRYQGDNEVQVTDMLSQSSQTGFYVMPAEESPDKYSIFLGGNYAHLHISSNKNLPRLLLIKDSYANSLVPFLALHFDIDLVDPRYCSPEYFRSLLNDNSFDCHVVIASASTLSSLNILEFL